MPTAKDQLAVATAIRDAIAALEWGTLQPIFAEASVKVSPNLDLSHTQLPAARVVLGSDTADPDTPGLRKVQLEIVLFNYDLRDDANKAAAIGWAVGASGTSAGERGIEAIARRVDLAIQNLARNVVPIVSRATGRGGWQEQEGRVVLTRSLSYEAWCAVEVE